MYDSHIYCREYKELKDQIVDIVNGETERTGMRNQESLGLLIYQNGRRKIGKCRHAACTFLFLQELNQRFNAVFPVQ